MTELSSKNECAKTVTKENAYEVWEVPGIGTHYVLKKYKSPKSEAADPYARWFCYVESQFSESGDVYAHEIMRYGHRIR